MGFRVMVCAAASAVGVVTFTCGARDAFSTYGSAWRTSQLPPVGPGSFDVKAEFLPDGRRLVVTGLAVLTERAPRSDVFDVVGLLDPSEVSGGTDPGFLRISPDGSTVAVGAGFGKPIVVFDVSVLGAPGSPATLASGSVAQYFDVPHYDAAWQTNNQLAITAGAFGDPAYVSLLDTRSPPGAPINPVIVAGIQGSSAGIVFDSAGRLYTGNGFDADGSSGSRTGTIRIFEPSSWGSGGTADFETGGVLLGDVLSANSLLFDLEGNLVVGGASETESGYLAVLHADAVARALAGFGPIDSADPLQLRRLDPLGTGTSYFGTAYDVSTGELFATSGRDWFGTIPAPGGATAAALLLVLHARRRRHA